MWLNDLEARRQQLATWAHQGHLAAGDYSLAATLVGVTPGRDHWRSALDRLLLMGGAVALAVGLLFMIAFNWQALPRLVKLGLVELAVFVPAGYAVWRGLALGAARAALLLATFSVGGLLALFGQTYQTGADPWQLFAGWAALCLPWLLAARWPPLTALLWVVANVGLVLWTTEMAPDWGMSLAVLPLFRPPWLQTLVLCNLLAWLLALARPLEPWLGALLRRLSGSTVLALLCWAVMTAKHYHGAAYLLLLAVVALFGAVHTLAKRDLPLLGLTALALVVGTVTIAAHGLLSGGLNTGGELLLLAILTLTLSGGAVAVLRAVQRFWQRRDAGQGAQA